jgi:hypothetical protein
MHQRLNLLHHRHTGQLQPHQHTAYLPLAFMVFLVGLALALFTFTATASTPYTGPESASVGLTGIMPAPPPTLAPTITSPHDGQHFTLTPITVSGSCPKDTLIEVYKNNIFAGSTPCSNGHFAIDIDLLFGQNILTAQAFDNLSQAGPMSKTVTVFYDYSLSNAAASSLLNLSGAQMLLTTDAAYRGSFPNQQLNVPITVIGGTPPFAINVKWGDSSNNLVPRSSNSTFNTSHAYKKPGTYKITLQGTDSKNLVAFLTVAAIINGKPDTVPTVAASKLPVNTLLMLWPVFAIAVTALVSFWIGERREKKILGVGKPQTPGFGTAAPPPPPAKPPTNPPAK